MSPRPLIRGIAWFTNQRAFTLVEFIASIAIIALLIGLVLTGVQTAREAARRTQCAANLRQLGAAMNLYHQSHEMFPPSHLESVKGKGWSSNRISGLTHLLPYLEQQALHAAINMTYAQVDSSSTPVIENRTARRTTVAAFLCPSDGELNHRNSYRLNRGCLVGRTGHLRWDGPFCLGVLPRAASITDGLAGTAFISERISGSYQYHSANIVRDYKYVTVPGPLFPPDDVYIPLCIGSAATWWNHTGGRYWLYNNLYFTEYNHNGIPNDPRPSCGYENGLQPPKSYHRGSVNVLFGDGHCTAITAAVSQQVWSALGTRDGGDH